MSSLRFTTADEAPPVDDAALLEPFHVEGAFPIAALAERFAGQVFDGSNGWAVDVVSGVNGFNALTVRAICSPDWVALNGAGFACIAAYGNGGPLASEYHSYAVGVVVVGSTVTVRGEYQDTAGVAKGVDVGSFEVPLVDWVQLTVTRERDGEGHLWAAYVQGEPVGSAATADSISFSQDTVWSLAHRVTLGVAGSFFDGAIERVDIEDTAATPVEERMAWRTRQIQETEYRAVIADHMPVARTATEQGVAAEPGTVYHAIRVRPFADSVGRIQARAENWSAASLLPSAYGSQLVRWERSLGIQPDTSIPVAQRQANALAEFADPGGFTVLRMRTIGATIMGVDVADVVAIEPTNRMEPKTVSVTEVPAQGPWTVFGDGTATYTATGLRMRSRLDVDLRWVAHERRAQECVIGTNVIPFTVAAADRVEGAGFAVTLVSLAGSSATQWSGIVMVADANTARHVGVYFDGADYQVAYRDSIGETLTAWTSLSTIALGGQVAVFFDLSLTVPEWAAVVNDTPADPNTGVLHAIGSPNGVSNFLRVGLVQASEGPLASDMTAVWTDALVQWPRTETGKKYYLQTTTPIAFDPVGQTNTLRANDRPTALGHITYLQIATADTVGAYVDFTPIAEVPVETAIRLGDDRPRAHRNLDWPPTNLWTFQEASAPILDRIGPTKLWEPAAVTVTYQDPGPDTDRFAVTLTSAGASYLEVQDPNFQDTGSQAIVGAIVAYRFDPGMDGTILEKTDGTIKIELRILAGQVELALDDGGGEQTIDIPNFDNTWIVAGFFTDDTGNCGLASATDNQSAGLGLVTLSNMGDWTLGSVAATSADATYRWIAWHSVMDPNDLQTACALLADSL